MTVHPIDTEALARRAGHILFTDGPEQPAATARETCVLLDLLAAAEHREEQMLLRNRNLLDASDRAEARIKAVRELHKRGEVMAWQEDCTNPEAHDCMDDPHGGGMLCTDEILGHYCHGCAPEDAANVDEYPWPCPTIRALEG